MCEHPAFETEGRVEDVLVATQRGSILSRSVESIQLIQGYGIRDDNHAGRRHVDVRERKLLDFDIPKGTEIANHREFSAISTEELAEIKEAMNLPGPIPHGCLGENLVISGIPKLTELPTGTLLFFQRGQSCNREAILVVWGENIPCPKPGEAIQENFPGIDRPAHLFTRAAIGRRGIAGSVYASGKIHAGDTVVVKAPRQRIYRPEED